MCVCTWIYVPWCTCVYQWLTSGVSSLLLLSGFQGSNSCHWAWCQVAFTAVLVNVSIFVLKHHDHEQLGEERVHFAYAFTSQSVTEGSQGKNSREEPRGRNCYRGALLNGLLLWLAQPAAYIIYFRTIWLGAALTTMARSSHINQPSRRCTIGFSKS